MTSSARESSAGTPKSSPSESPTRVADHLAIAEARDLLDWLEGQKIRPTDVVIEADGTMTVRWTA